MQTKTEGLIDYVILSEFDINLGSIVKYQHPQAVPSVDQGVIASYMLPEGGHNRASDTTYFVLNRKKGKDLQADMQRIQTEGALAYLNGKYFTPERVESLKALVSRGRLLAGAGDGLKLY